MLIYLLKNLSTHQKIKIMKKRNLRTFGIAFLIGLAVSVADNYVGLPIAAISGLGFFFILSKVFPTIKAT